jgi:hypothetical protein
MPSEGKGQRFESPRARHEIKDLDGPDQASVPEVSRWPIGVLPLCRRQPDRRRIEQRGDALEAGQQIAPNVMLE